MSANNATKVKDMAIEIIFGLIVLSLIAALFLWAMGLFNSKKQELATETEEISLMKFTSIEGHDVTGNSVLTYLSQWKNQEVCITVKTKKNTTHYNYTDDTLGTPVAADKNRENILNASLKKKANFINPNGMFHCSLNRDDNDSIVGIVFEQQ